MGGPSLSPSFSFPARFVGSRWAALGWRHPGAQGNVSARGGRAPPMWGQLKPGATKSTWPFVNMRVVSSDLSAFAQSGNAACLRVGLPLWHRIHFQITRSIIDKEKWRLSYIWLLNRKARLTLQIKQKRVHPGQQFRIDLLKSLGDFKGTAKYSPFNGYKSTDQVRNESSPQAEPQGLIDRYE